MAAPRSGSRAPIAGSAGTTFHKIFPDSRECQDRRITGRANAALHIRQPRVRAALGHRHLAPDAITVRPSGKPHPTDVMCAVGDAPCTRRPEPRTADTTGGRCLETQPNHSGTPRDVAVRFRDRTQHAHDVRPPRAPVLPGVKSSSQVLQAPSPPGAKSSPGTKASRHQVLQTGRCRMAGCPKRRLSGLRGRTKYYFVCTLTPNHERKGRESRK